MMDAPGRLACVLTLLAAAAMDALYRVATALSALLRRGDRIVPAGRGGS